MGIARKRYYVCKCRESAKPSPFLFAASFLYRFVSLVLFLTTSLFVFLQEDTRKRYDAFVKKLLDVHVVMTGVRDLKERETQKQYDEALQRERGNRQRLIDIHSAELNAAIVLTERKTERAWEKISGKLQSQVGVLQTQAAQFELQRVRQERQWSNKEQHAKGIELKLRADLTVMDRLSCWPNFFIL